MNPCISARELRGLPRLAARCAFAVVALLSGYPTQAASQAHQAGPAATAAAATQAPALSVFHISVEPAAKVSKFDTYRLQQRCMEELPRAGGAANENPAHTGDYEAHLYVVSVEPFVELLEPGAAADSLVQRGLRTIRKGLGFWAHPALATRPVFLGAPTAVHPDLEMGPYPDDPRVLIEVFRRKGQRIKGRVEILFADHEPHPFELALVQMPTASFHRTVNWGYTDDDASVTVLARSPIQWSAGEVALEPMLLGANPALEVLRLQLSPYTDRQKRRLFELHGERYGHRDTQRLELPLWRLDMTENAVVIAVGCMWLDDLAREHGRELSAAEVDAVLNQGAPGVRELLEMYAATREGAAALIGSYTTNPVAVAAKLGSVLDR